MSFGVQDSSARVSRWRSTGSAAVVQAAGERAAVQSSSHWAELESALLVRIYNFVKDVIY